MTGQNQNKLNQLERDLPEGLLVDTLWFKGRGYSRQLLNHYVTTGWLEQPARGVYRRPRGSIGWQQAVISLQTLLGYPLVIGGRTALEWQGYAHYLLQTDKEVHLYGPKPPPNWVHKLPVGTRFLYHNNKRLFRDMSTARAPRTQSPKPVPDGSARPDTEQSAFVVQPWGQWDWPLTLSTPERAVFELLDELPAHESFEQVDKLMEGLTNLSPRRLQTLLADCGSVKVKRLFLFFADRHRHGWSKRLKREEVDLGTGKRMLVKGGRLDPTYLITVPEELYGVL